MKESKCGKIPPCYGSLEFAIYEEAKKVNDEWKKSRVLHGKMIDKLRGKLMEGGFLDDTHDKVYELNRHLCDLEIDRNRWDKIGEEWASKKKEIVDSIFNKIDMEKKMNPMTKAEAFEFFKRKKILARGADVNIDVQKKLFQCGIEWIGGGSSPCYHSDYLLIDDAGRLSHYGCDDKFWFAHYYESIYAADIISLEILEDKNNEFVDCSEPCPEIKAVQELLRNSNHLKDKIIVITKDNAAIL